MSLCSVLGDWVSYVLIMGISAGLARVFRRFSLYYRLFHAVDKESAQNGGDLVAQVLKSHGIKHVFTLSGGHISPILVGAEKVGIRVVDTRHEVNAVFAADAVARLTGNVGVAAVTAGPGVTNTITAVKNAQMAESPVLLLGGAAASAAKGRGALQDIDQLSLFKSLCKFNASCATVREIVPTLREAICIAKSGTPGPVFVELPIDVLYPYKLVQSEIGMKEEPKTLLQKAVGWYLSYYLHNLFAAGFDPQDTGPLPLKIPMPSDSQIQQAAQVFSTAKKPVFILGSQVMLPPEEADKIRKCVETFGVPCFLGGMSRGLLGSDSPIQMRHCRREALKEADVVLLAGAVCDFRLSYGRVLSSKSKIIAVNRSKEQLYKNTDAFWKPTVAVQADVGSFITRLAAALPGFKCDPDWVEGLRQKDFAKEKTNAEMAFKPVDRHLNPMRILTELDKVLPEDTIYVADGGDFVGTAAYIVRPRGPLKWLDPGAFGTLGVGGGFALGAKLCKPESTVVILYGDGSLGYSIMEIDTFVRHKIPVMSVVGNDACWMQISREQVKMFNSNVACGLAFSNYEECARGLGGEGILLQGGDEKQIQSKLKEAVELNKSGKSVLVNCLIGKTDFREGSISV